MRVSSLNTVNTLISLTAFLLSHVRRNSSLTGIKECIVRHRHLKIVYKWALHFSTLAITCFNYSKKLFQAAIIILQHY